MTQLVLDGDQWPPMPRPHRAFLEAAIPTLRADPRLVGLAAGGSFATRSLDEHSDLDLVIVVDPQVARDVLRDGQALARALGPLLVAFTGEHVGEPRLLICLYGPPVLHVDLKFLSPDELASRVEDPSVLWDRDGQVRSGLSRGGAAYPQPDLQWIEDRFWVWVHYIAVKIARGELFEALDALAFVRRRVLGPLILREAGMRPDGVRRVEAGAPGPAASLRSTVGSHDAASCRNALDASIALYADLRARLAPPDLLRRAHAEREVRAFLGGRWR